jgi:hypothetical protein
VLLRVLLTAVVFLGLSLSAQAEKRLALVIGNSHYRNVPELDNPVRDGEAMAKVLRSIGFEAEARLDLDRASFESALADFAQRADDADIALIYFAGHGIEVDGKNYLIPVDAKLATDKRARFELISLDDVLASLDGVKGLRAVFLDACRNNPFVASMTRSKATRSITQGFTPIEAQNGTIISYAAKEGTVAADGLGQHSPYASALLELMPQPGLEIQFMLRKVRDKVQNLTGGKQEPYISASISGDPIYLVAPAAPDNSAPSTALTPVQTDFQAATAINTVGGWQAFLDKHGEDTSNFYVRLAVEARQKALQTASAPESGGQGAIREIESQGPEATVEGAAVSGPESQPDSEKSRAVGASAKDKSKPDKAKASKLPRTDIDKADRTKPATQKKTYSKKEKPQKAKASGGDRPNAMRYSYKVWSEGSLRSGRPTTASTEYGTLRCTALISSRKNRGETRFCSWK